MSNLQTSLPRLFLLFAVLPLLFIAGVQLVLFSEQTDHYFAWTITLPLTAAFLGSGYWSALIAAYMSSQQKVSVWNRITGPTAIAATGILGIATLVHLDKFHLDSPELLTRFVTWVWIVVYAISPFVFLALWIKSGQRRDQSMGAHPFRLWIRAGFAAQALFTLLAGLILFISPGTMIPYWPWTLTPLTARAISAWMTAYGLACITIFRENDLPNTAAVRASLLGFCILQLIVLARYFSSVDWSKPLAWLYVLFLLIGAIVLVASMLANRLPRSA